jgi:hypothetical protein
MTIILNGVQPLQEIAPIAGHNGKYLKTDGVSTEWSEPTGGTVRWVELLPEVNFSLTPLAEMIIEMLIDKSGVMAEGLPVRYTVGGDVRYGQINTITPTRCFIRGVPLSTATGSLTAFAYGTPDMIVSEVFDVPGTFNDGVGGENLLAGKLSRRFRWGRPMAHCIGFSNYVRVIDTGISKPRLWVTRNGANTTTSGALLNSESAWDSTMCNANPTAYTFYTGSILELKCQGGTNLDSLDLSVEVTFVLP